MLEAVPSPADAVIMLGFIGLIYGLHYLYLGDI